MQTKDAVAVFCRAAEDNDVAAMVATLAPDAELTSPLFGRMVFRGQDDLSVLLGAVFGGLRDLHWYDLIGTGTTRVALSRAKIGGLAIHDAMVVELDDAGLIRRISPHLRPWLSITFFAIRLGPKMARRPDVVRRALSRDAAART